jgi:hypothetical protein
MSVTREYESSDLSDEFAEIERAVMESARGRWFLAEHARRERAADAELILAAIRRLEAALGAKLKPATAPAELGPDNMRYYRQDEDIFEPVPGIRADRPALRVISAPATEPPAEPAAEKIASRVTIKRIAPETPEKSDASIAQPTISASVQAEIPAVAQTSPGPDKPRIFVVRRSSSDELAIPLANMDAEDAVA